ncbi:3-hydroxybutyryl-CoA dehydrogenase [Nonomuraea sp. NPDC048882]|uniref:3-hydroxybutyryl-CoA dehydrogenase n=1 Tax=unclassified Nonomuraea TaxID=2593643 RepID=UPI000A98251F
MNQPEKIGVVGCGLMGAGIADVCARAGLDVRVAVQSPAAGARGLERVTRSLGQGVRKGAITTEQRDAALARVSFTTDLHQLADREFVVEAVPEDEALKLHVFGELDKIIEDPQAVLASNTSSIPIIRLARATSRPERVIGVHFFSPVPLLPLVELVASLLTAERTRERAAAFVSGVLGKEVIESQDRAGFLINTLLIPYLLSAMRMVESGFADAEMVDKGMTLGCGHPVGPLRLADLIGLDTVTSIASALYQELKQPQLAPPPILLRMVEGGLLGRKTGRGFHAYP